MDAEVLKHCRELQQWLLFEAVCFRVEENLSSSVQFEALLMKTRQLKFVASFGCRKTCLVVCIVQLQTFQTQKRHLRCSINVLGRKVSNVWKNPNFSIGQKKRGYLSMVAMETSSELRTRRYIDQRRWTGILQLFRVDCI